MKRSTISKIVKSILDQTYSGTKLLNEDVREETFKRMANEATIILKTHRKGEKSYKPRGAGF